MRRYKATQKMAITLASLLLALTLAWCEAKDSFIPIPQDGEPPVLYSNQVGDPLLRLYSDAIDRAENSIFLTIYSLTDPKIIDQLKKRADQGIEVTVVYDPKASPKIPWLLGKKINAFARIADGIMHQKILIIDDKETWIGSANMTGESLKMHGNLITAIRSQEVAKFALEKARSLLTFSPKPLAHRRFIVGDQPLELWFLPDDPSAILRIKKLIQSAQKTIKIAMFTWTRHDLAIEIIKAKKRGVEVEIILDQNAANGAGKSVTQMLDRANISLSINEGRPLIHYKFAWIDGTTLVNGSANWTKAAFTQNDDCFIVLENLTPQQQEVLTNVWQRLKESL